MSSIQVSDKVLAITALRVNSRQYGKSRQKTVYAALGVNLEEKKEILGLWILETERAKFWASVLNEILNGGPRTF
jgi:transposase-like protein